MQHFQDLKQISLEGSLVTIGSFDGVHIGHQQIIHSLVDQAHHAGKPAVVVTFHPHPQLVLKEEIRPYYLTMPEKRAQLLGELGVDLVLTYPFTPETSRMSPEDFISQLHEHLKFSELWVGYDFALGKDRLGTPSHLQEIGQGYKYEIHEISAYSHEGELVSSSSIRNKIRTGQIRKAAQLLGRPFEISGEVIMGEKRGKSLGFATSNLEVLPEMVDIKPGVYACRAIIRRKTYSAVTNIGYRPTFGEDLEAPRIEAHVLDFSEDLYGDCMELVFIDRLRDEMKFAKVSDLVDQISNDVKQAREILES
jgi:riboflavin kinase/FMN adenylyltransferase